MPTAISLETGTGSTTANSYISVANYKTYRDDRYAATDPAPSDNTIITYIYRAMSYFESLNFKGHKHTEDQALQFPRGDLVIDGYGIDNDTIPVEVLEAMYELTFAYEQGFAPDAPVSRETIAESVGGVSVTYKNSSAHQTLTPAVTNALRKLVKPSLSVTRV
jgi:hypothetical protein